MYLCLVSRDGRWPGPKVHSPTANHVSTRLPSVFSNSNCDERSNSYSVICVIAAWFGRRSIWVQPGRDSRGWPLHLVSQIQQLHEQAVTHMYTCKNMLKSACTCKLCLHAHLLRRLLPELWVCWRPDLEKFGFPPFWSGPQTSA